MTKAEKDSLIEGTHEVERLFRRLFACLECSNLYGAMKYTYLLKYTAMQLEDKMMLIHMALEAKNKDE